MQYCEEVHKTVRRPTREVMVGNVGVGGSNPVRVQSMTTSDTRNVEDTVEQIIKLADAGCEIARMTVQGNKEAEACEQIKNLLIQKGYTIPLVADIHFFPAAAMRVVDFVDKVRINPGNYVDKRATFKQIEYTDEEYAQELLRIEEKFTPLVEKCKQLKRAMRIGTNHGSLSDRIMNRYGDTPAGMVESALEFARICRNNDYHDIIFSMKASNTQVMIQAYRLLAAKMYDLGWDYPLHLGVTEAGDGEDGRIKSAIGIGSLLMDGIGDTIRVSLTEDPWYEIDPCKRLVNIAQEYVGKGVEPFEEKHRDIENYHKRQIHVPNGSFLHHDGTVIVPVDLAAVDEETLYLQLGCDIQLGRPMKQIDSVDAIYLKRLPQNGEEEKILERLIATEIAVLSDMPMANTIPIVPLCDADEQHGCVLRVAAEPEEMWKKIKTLNPQAILYQPSGSNIHHARRFFEWLQENGCEAPVIFNFIYNDDQEDFVLKASAECGSLFCDGLGDGLFLETTFDPGFIRNISFRLLQGARKRTTKTEFISCPSCGRTLFDLQDVTRKIRSRTEHLPGVKIAIMGCIVNGPGEMADADFGYVGSKPGKIDLYVGKERVERDIEFNEAEDRLVTLIKDRGRWVDP